MSKTILWEMQNLLFQKLPLTWAEPTLIHTTQSSHGDGLDQEQRPAHRASGAEAEEASPTVTT